MASFVYNNASKLLNDGTLKASDVLKVMLLKTTAAPANHNDTAVSAALTAAEIVATNYVGGFGGAGRKTATVTNSVDNALPGSKWILGNVTWTALGGATNDTIGAAALIKEVTSDAASIPVAFWSFGAVMTGSTTSGAAAVTGLAGTAGLAVGMPVTGTGIAGGATIATITSSTALTLSANATASGTPSLTFGAPIPTNGSDFTLSMDASGGNVQFTT